ncbi:MAG: hypothetical protein KA715_00600 [Xanthomonadaceae bacterium]|nr:hypothetical protein [Xanthomonadaceae bacterium]
MKSSPVDIIFHDQSQIEIRTQFKVPNILKNKQAAHFQQDMFVFIPNSFGLDKESYPKDEFFRSLTHFIRLKTPKFLEAEEREQALIDLIMPTFWTESLDKHVITHAQDVVTEVRLFGTYVNDQLKKVVAGQNLQKSELRFMHVVNMVRTFRRVMDECVSLPGEPLGEDVRKGLLYIDEFISNRLEETVAQLVSRGSGVETVLPDEFARREKMGYLQVLTEGDNEVPKEGHREMYLYRMGRLKKYVFEVLYLEVDRVRKDKAATHMSAALGAAIAACLNAILNPTSANSSMHWVAQQFSNSLSLMIGVVVLMYVFQDRAKDYLRDVFIKKFKSWVADYSFSIVNPNGMKIGRCQENFQYRSIKTIDQDVAELRNAHEDDLLRFGNTEEIVHYGRRMKIKTEALRNLYKNTHSLMDVLHYDLQPFISKLSDSVRVDRFFNRSLKTVAVALPKVYHVNVVIRHRVLDAGKRTLEQYFFRARVVMDKSGIKRVEKVEPENPVILPSIELSPN